MNHNHWLQELSKGRFHEQFFPMEHTFLICLPGKGGGSAGGQGSEGIQTLINWVSNLKLRAPKKFNSIQEPIY